jgi:hypothetical protein
MRAAIPLLAALALAACSKPDNAEGPGGVTVGEAKALDEAAEMLDAAAAPPPSAPAPPPAAPQPSASPQPTAAPTG